MELSLFYLTARTKRVLKDAGFTTLEQVKVTSDESLLAIKGFGVVCLKEVRDLIKKQEQAA